MYLREHFPRTVLSNKFERVKLFRPSRLTPVEFFIVVKNRGLAWFPLLEATLRGGMPPYDLSAANQPYATHTAGVCTGADTDEADRVPNHSENPGSAKN